MGKTRKKEKTQLAKNLILRRFDMGMSGERFAEYLEIPYGTLRDIEAGISNGRASTKLKIAKKLGISIDELEGPTPGERTKTEHTKSEILGRLMTVLPTLDEGKLRALLDFVRDLSAGSSAILDEARLELETKLNQKNK